jgi:hypothetical protein
MQSCTTVATQKTKVTKVSVKCPHGPCRRRFWIQKRIYDVLPKLSDGRGGYELDWNGQRWADLVSPLDKSLHFGKCTLPNIRKCVESHGTSFPALGRHRKRNLERASQEAAEKFLTVHCKIAQEKYPFLLSDRYTRSELFEFVRILSGDLLSDQEINERWSCFSVNLSRGLEGSGFNRALESALIFLNTLEYEKLHAIWHSSCKTDTITPEDRDLGKNAFAALTTLRCLLFSEQERTGGEVRSDACPQWCNDIVTSLFAEFETVVQLSGTQRDQLKPIRCVDHTRPFRLVRLSEIILYAIEAVGPSGFMLRFYRYGHRPWKEVCLNISMTIDRRHRFLKARLDENAGISLDSKKEQIPAGLWEDYPEDFLEAQYDVGSDHTSRHHQHNNWKLITLANVAHFHARVGEHEIRRILKEYGPEVHTDRRKDWNRIIDSLSRPELLTLFGQWNSPGFFNWFTSVQQGAIKTTCWKPVLSSLAEKARRSKRIAVHRKCLARLKRKTETKKPFSVVSDANHTREIWANRDLPTIKEVIQVPSNQRLISYNSA